MSAMGSYDEAKEHNRKMECVAFSLLDAIMVMAELYGGEDPDVLLLLGVLNRHMSGAPSEVVERLCCHAQMQFAERERPIVVNSKGGRA